MRYTHLRPESIDDHRPLSAIAANEMVPVRRGSADATTIRLIALLTMTASSGPNRNIPMRRGNRNSAPPSPIRPPSAPIPYRRKRHRCRPYARQLAVLSPSCTHRFFGEDTKPATVYIMRLISAYAPLVRRTIVTALLPRLRQNQPCPPSARAVSTPLSPETLRSAL